MLRVAVRWLIDTLPRIKHIDMVVEVLELNQICTRVTAIKIGPEADHFAGKPGVATALVRTGLTG